MELEKIFKDFLEKMTQLTLLQRSADNVFMKEIKALELYKNEREKQPDIDSKYVDLHNMFFRIAGTGEHYFYSHVDRSIEEKELSTYVHKNRQYQWILAEAYEEFEDFLEGIYACAAYHNHNLWPLGDFGNIRFQEIEGKNFKWFLEQAKRKKGGPKAIIKDLKKVLPIINDAESNNSLNIDLGFAIAMIEMFRHIIVHNGGRVKNKDDFSNKIFEKCGLSKKGQIADEYRNYILYFFGRDYFEDKILLLERPIDSGLPGHHKNIVDELNRYLMAYAHMVYIALDKYIKN
ncbi:hypothetical protein [Oceanospirillum maris]|uniref:hypothetical protein n=1 Tax=Oceanospirillum maris TaxID=64977 RepID=UPI000419A0F5|nr:hypothetical protein [Oceanospirillum maris]